MANRRVSVIRSVKVNGIWKFLSPGNARKLRVRDDAGRWYICWLEGNKKCRERCDSWSHALLQKNKKQAELHAISAGVELAAPKVGRLTFEQAVDQFNDDLRLRDMRARTVASYKLVFELFQKSCSKTYLDQIDRRDLLKFAVSLRKDGLSPRTVSNRWQTIQAFLKHHGITGLAKRGDAPKFVEAEADAYSREDIATFLAACTPEQYLLYNFYLCTGFRMQEVIFLQYSDIDFKHKTVSVKVKPDFNFGPKGWECRTVPLTEALAVALEARQSERKASTLVFPTRSGRLNTKHLQALKRIAKRAGLDETQWWLHKFRATFATWHLQAGIDIRTVQMYLGHKDISTTLRYLQPARGTAAQEKFNQTFAGVH